MGAPKVYKAKVDFIHDNLAYKAGEKYEFSDTVAEQIGVEKLEVFDENTRGSAEPGAAAPAAEAPAEPTTTTPGGMSPGLTATPPAEQKNPGKPSDKPNGAATRPVKKEWAGNHTVGKEEPERKRHPALEPKK